MAQAAIRVSSSPEPTTPSQNNSSSKRAPKRGKPTSKAGPSRSRSITIIELSDSDDDELSVRVKPVAGPSNSRRRPAGQKLGSGSSVENIPVETRTKTPGRASEHTPLFLPSDEENNPPFLQKVRRRTPVAPEPFPFQADMNMDMEPQPVPPPQPGPALARAHTRHPGAVIDVDLAAPNPTSDIAKPETQLAHAELDSQSMITAQVLEIIPDVEPDYLLALITQHTTAHPEHSVATAVELLLHGLFEDPKYPKVDRFGKGKRKAEENVESGGDGSKGEETPNKKLKMDYKDVQREHKGGEGYKDSALEYLQVSFPYTTKTYLRSILGQHNGFYAPSHFFLLDLEKGNAKLPYVKRTTPYRPKGKGRAGPEDEELERERKWLLSFLEGNEDDTGAKRVHEVGEEAQESDGECEASEGIECACCFSHYRFDKMIQCPETHLFCSSCMLSYASTLLGAHDPKIKCMDQSNCSALFPESELRRFLPQKMMDLYERVKQKKEIAEADLEGLEECPFCEWGCVMERTFEEEKLLRCGNSECGRVSCRSCKKDDHLPKSCKEVEEDKHLDGKHAVEEAMTQAMMRNCPKCQKPFIKESGCNKMTCPNCRTLSCYICRKVIAGYDHFNQQQPGMPMPAGGSNNPNAGKCLLWDSVEQRHADEVKAAAERAQQQYREENPDVDEDALKVDLPVAPPPAANPQAGVYQQQVDAAQAALDRALRELQQREAEEHAHREVMVSREDELSMLQQAGQRMPEMRREYEKMATNIRRQMMGDQQEWYRLRTMVENGNRQVQAERARLEQARAVAQVYGAAYGAAYGAVAGMNHMWAAPMPAPVIRRPVRQAPAPVVRLQAQRAPVAPVARARAPRRRR